MKRKHVYILAIGLVIIISLGFTAFYLINNYIKKSSTNTPVYVTLAGHIEDGEYYSVCKFYPQYRNMLLEFAELLKSYYVPFNLQIDYAFFEGAASCETPAMQEETNGTNTIDYLAKYCNFEIDPHQGGGWEEPGENNYADVRYLGGEVTTEITETAGGVVWDQEEQFTRFNEGESGYLHPEFTWYPEILTMGVHTNHHLGDFSLDDLTAGIWKPKGFGDDFFTHDEEASMVYIGPGGHHSDWFGNREWPFDSVANYVEVLVDYLEEGKIPRGKMYTVTLAVPQKIIFNETNHVKLTDQLDQLAPLVEEGKVIYEPYSRIVEIWHEEFKAEPNVFTFDEINTSDYD
ncbi:MAG: hypothetical protein GF308_13700 [Candidatus Heimdallarchaeota archaeon]|nr:hypothetical protein [Candidatus Heimdallarchaeota archaeon]